MDLHAFKILWQQSFSLFFKILQDKQLFW